LCHSWRMYSCVCLWVKLATVTQGPKTPRVLLTLSPALQADPTPAHQLNGHVVRGCSCDELVIGYYVPRHLLAKLQYLKLFHRPGKLEGRGIGFPIIPAILKDCTIIIMNVCNEKNWHRKHLVNFLSAFIQNATKLILNVTPIQLCLTWQSFVAMGTGIIRFPVEIVVFNQTIDAHVEETMFTSVTLGVFVAHYTRNVVPIFVFVCEWSTSQSE